MLPSTLHSRRVGSGIDVARGREADYAASRAAQDFVPAQFRFRISDLADFSHPCNGITGCNSLSPRLVCCCAVGGSEHFAGV